MTDHSNDVTVHGYAADGNGGSLASRPVAGYADPALTELEGEHARLLAAWAVVERRALGSDFGANKLLWQTLSKLLTERADVILGEIEQRRSQDATARRLAAEAQAREVRG